MQKLVLFCLAVLSLLLIVFIKPTVQTSKDGFGSNGSQTQRREASEGFQNLMGVNWTSKNDGTPKALYTDLPVNQPNVVDLAEVGVGNIPASPAPASDLPTAPFYQRANETPNPYKNPTTEPAKYIQLLGVKEDLQAFFGFQAAMLEERNDPAIQMPLTRARADMGELIDVQSVIERNPGLPSRITNKQLDDIRSNLRYLRATLYELESSGAIEPETIEGFEGFVAAPASRPAPRPASRPAPKPAPKSDARPATLKELQEFQIKVVVEITRLQASGTSDPVVVGRTNVLNQIKKDVDDTITKLQTGAITPDTSPILYSDIKAAFPLLGKTTSPLPTILQKTKLPAPIANLFPGGLSPKDTEQALQINNIIKGYMKNIFEGSSWGVDLHYKYDNPNIAKLKAQAASTPVVITTDPSIMSGLPGVSYQQPPSYKGASRNDPSASSTDTMKQNTDSSYSHGLPGLSNRIQQLPEAGRMDWKERASQIKQQIQRRGLNPNDFGAIPDGTSVSKEFSWRGHTQMMCNRLNTTTDPGLAMTVGCPPPEWEGWRK